MRIRYLLSLIFLVAAFNACQKEIKQTAATSSAISNTEGAPYDNLTFSQNPAFVGQSVNISGALQDNTAPECGTLRIEQAVDGDGNPTSSALAVDWVSVAEVTPGTKATVSFDWVPTATGYFGFRLHFIPNESCNGEAYNGIPGPGMDLQVIESCSGLSVAVTEATATLISGNLYSVHVCFTVNTCGEPYTNVKLQGGLTANADNSTIVIDPNFPKHTSIRIKNQTAVIAGRAAKFNGIGTACVTFQQTFDGPAPYKVTGAWSVVGTNTSGVTIKSVYTEPVVFWP